MVILTPRRRGVKKGWRRARGKKEREVDREEDSMIIKIYKS
jgi:hypothetical protein